MRENPPGGLTCRSFNKKKVYVIIEKFSLYFTHLPMSHSSILFDELTFTLDWAWSAGRPDHATAAAWPRFESRTVSLSVLVADSSSVVLNMLCGFVVFDVRSRTLHTYFVFYFFL